MDLIQISYIRLFPTEEFLYQTEMEYNRRLGNFNANILLKKNMIKINLNLQWKDIDDEIKIGLIQHLLLKIFKKKLNTQNISLYNNFVKQIPLLTPKTKSDPLLDSSFNRVNLNYFHGEMEKPNLQWGKHATRKLAHYNFHDDSVTVSSIFIDVSEHILDYIMYHELLHKFHKFKHNNGRSLFHSKEFRQDESKYPNHQQVEKEITTIIRNKQKSVRKGLWKFF
jgi:predicted metal-dependent hydrolase